MVPSRGGHRGQARLKKCSSSLLKKASSGPAVDDSIMHHESLGLGMRGAFADQGGLFSYISPEARVPADHPLRQIRELVRDVLSGMNRDLGKLYASEGRPSTPPEQLLSALLLQVFYGIRSERQLMNWTTIFCTAGSWDCRRMIRCGIRPPSPRTGSGCRPAMCSRSS